MKVLEVLGVRVEMPTNQPIVLLRERDGDRYLPIWIGAAEATAIAYAQQGVVRRAPDPRPAAQRHRRARSRADSGRASWPSRTASSTRSSTSTGSGAGGTDVESRSSDAIALALRAGAEIVADEDLLAEAGVEMSETEDDEVEKFQEFLDQVSADDFDTEAGDRSGPTRRGPWASVVDLRLFRL